MNPRLSMRRNPAVVLALMFVVAWSWAAIPTLRAAQPLPDRLSDEAFWHMVEDFSEDSGYFTSENFSSNERGYETLIPKLAVKIPAGGVYLGVGPEQNFQYIASLKPRMAFIIDIRRQNAIQHLMYKAAFELSADRADFLSRVFSRKRPEGLSSESTVRQLFDAYSRAMSDAAYAETNRKEIKQVLTEKHKFRLSLDDLRTLDHVFDVFAAYGPAINYNSNIDGLGRLNFQRGGNNVAYADLMVLTDREGMNRSYLASEDSFHFMKDLEERNLLVPVVGNFGGPKAIRAVGQYLKDQSATVSLFYLSNVEQYLFRPPQGGPSIAGEFYENVASLPLAEFSTFIRSGNAGTARAGGLTPMMSSIKDVLDAFKLGEIRSQRDVLSLSAN